MVGRGMADTLTIERQVVRRDRASSIVRRAPQATDRVGRLIDIAIALLAIVFAAPLLVAVALAVWLCDGGPPIYGHERKGLGGTPFRCLKFRSMSVNADEILPVHLAGDPAARLEWARSRKLQKDPRVTPIGDFLRRSSLDELPQLFNVLRGDMAIVGPRPIVADEVPLYGARYAVYCSVRPGITGLWQVSGRSDVAYRRRVAMDTVYAKNKSLWWDVKLITLTVPALLLAKGSY